MQFQVLELEEGEGYLTTAVIDSPRGFIYFGTDTISGRIIRVNLKEFYRVDSIQLSSFGDGYLVTSIIDIKRGYAYFG